jgi:FtsP/CotA-like multicopper oxidase with cupredoxin domain
VHAHGVKYDEGSAGVEPVPPGATFTYTWEVDPRAGPQPGEPSSKLWLYHSHVNEQRDVAAGLLGPMLISAKGTLKPDGAPRDVDREFVVILYTLDEQQSPYLDTNIAQHIIHVPGLCATMSVVCISAALSGTMSTELR